MTINEILELEKYIAEKIEEIKSNIIKEIKGQNTNYKPFNSFCGVIKFSDLKTDNWTPEYHIPDLQAKLVEKELKSISTVHSLQNKLKTLIETQSVKIPSITYYTKGYMQKLNPKTITILKKYYNEGEL